ncbi:MAG: hypothetical protein RLZZ393_261, partial [Pseudomonadota bacterium]
TAFGLLFTPVFYILCRKLATARGKSVPKMRITQ